MGCPVVCGRRDKEFIIASVSKRYQNLEKKSLFFVVGVGVLVASHFDTKIRCERFSKIEDKRITYQHLDLRDVYRTHSISLCVLSVPLSLSVCVCACVCLCCSMCVFATVRRVLCPLPSLSGVDFSRRFLVSSNASMGHLLRLNLRFLLLEHANGCRSFSFVLLALPRDFPTTFQTTFQRRKVRACSRVSCGVGVGVGIPRATKN